MASSTLLSRLPPSGHSLDITHFPSACLLDLWAALGPLLSWVESSFLDSAPTPGHHVIHTAPVSMCTMNDSGFDGSDSLSCSQDMFAWMPLRHLRLIMSLAPECLHSQLSGEVPLFQVRLRNVDSPLPSFLHYHFPALT